MKNEREKVLPKWAQAELAQLRADLAAQVQRPPHEHDDDPMHEPTVRLDPKQTVLFKMPDGELRVKLSEDRQRLEVRECSIGLPRLVVEPVSANALALVLVPR